MRKLIFVAMIVDPDRITQDSVEAEISEWEGVTAVHVTEAKWTF